MSYRSWLKDVKRVEDIGELPNNETPEQLKRWSARMKFQPDRVSETDFEFFQSRCHDSSILWTEKDRSNYQFAYSDDMSSELRHAIDGLLGITTWNAVFPVLLTFENCCYVNFVTPGQSGFFEWFDVDNIEIRQVERNEFPRDEFMCGWFFEQDSRLQAILSACRNTAHEPFRPEFYALIDCEGFKAKSLISEFAHKNFGPEGREVFADYEEHFSTQAKAGNFVWPHGEVELIEELLRKHSLSRESVESWRAANPFEYKLRKPSKSSPQAGAATGF